MPADAEAKLIDIEAQIRACERGEANLITCPYCSHVNVEGDPLCCREFTLASMAVIDRMVIADAIEKVDRIAEHVSRN